MALSAFYPFSINQTLRLKYTVKSILKEPSGTPWLFWNTGAAQNHNNGNKIRLMGLLNWVMLLTFLHILPESWWSVKGNGCRSLWAQAFGESGIESFSSEGSSHPFIHSSLSESQMWATSQFTGKQCIIILWKNNLVAQNKTTTTKKTHQHERAVPQPGRHQSMQTKNSPRIHLLHPPWP